MASETVRAFLAVELSDGIKDEAWERVKPVQAALPSFRFIDVKNWHLTLHFFGETPLADLERVKTALEPALKELEPFSLSLEGLGAFPNLSHPNLVWIGVTGNLRALETLKETVDRVLSRLKFQVERRTFHPHVTIARAKKQDSQKRSAPEVPFKGKIADRIECVTLFQSKLTPSGAVHTPLYRLSLG